MLYEFGVPFRILDHEAENLLDPLPVFFRKIFHIAVLRMQIQDVIFDILLIVGV